VIGQGLGFAVKHRENILNARLTSALAKLLVKTKTAEI